MKGKKTGGRKKGTPNKATREIREAARAVLERPEYLAGLQARIDAGSAPAIEGLLYHYAYGKPKDTVLVEGSIPPFVLRVEPSDG